MNKPLHRLKFDNSFSALPDIFYTRHQSRPLKNQHLIHFNHELARQVEIDPDLENKALFIEQITNSQSIEGYDCIAQCYAGHQFGQYVSRLGDGRALLLGEIVTSDNQRWDLQLKGAGVTEYSRGGDGRAVLRSTIREYLCSEAMHGLGIPTSRALCMIGSEEEVYREEIESGAILVRMAQSHIRFGTFEFYYYNNRYDEINVLADYVIKLHFPFLKMQENPYLALLQHVIQSTAGMIAKWQSVGFCHGVMNTDNMSIHGLTIDYGPFGFLDQFDRNYVCNHSDHQGRYAYSRQPEMGLFNVSCFAQTLLPLLDKDADKSADIAVKALQRYSEVYTREYADLMRAKLGFISKNENDQNLCNELLEMMQEYKTDYTLFFRALSQQEQTHVSHFFKHSEKFNQWFISYRRRLQKDGISEEQRSREQKKVNPKYILRNYMAEQAIQKAQQGDYSEIDQLYNVLKNPFDEQPEYEHYAAEIPDWANKIPVSCSS